jgi:hypothetical protein
VGLAAVLVPVAGALIVGLMNGDILVGYLGWKDFMRVRTRLPDEERNRTTFLGRRAKPSGSQVPQSR